ncbi:hypothetical protein P691DRAFT_774106 [Macrolepiota fuliginosa MF-IS2]|uniref:DUF6534 domain-containing protein n=1 Tax=Macrolepiota fuliginosa MF-IS2 TaxID=1400762 RepID=A0A9P5XFV7_9AGAR|nr:hypothetical protein P691DRAFT_774106 [Macrolepiota fuliginosa MF-IS2]
MGNLSSMGRTSCCGFIGPFSFWAFDIHVMDHLNTSSPFKRHQQTNRRFFSTIPPCFSTEACGHIMNVTSLNLDPIDSAGSQLIGLILNWGLFGLLVAQVFTYYTEFMHDWAVHKLLVHVVFILEIVQTIVMTHNRYETFVLRFGDPLASETIQMTWFVVPVLCGIIGCIAQVFYAHRIYKISKSRALSAVILVLAIVQLASAVVEGAQAYHAEYFFVLRSKVLPVTAIWLLSTSICDILITVSMTYFVRPPLRIWQYSDFHAVTEKLVKLRHDFHHASFLVSKLIMLTVETGAVTATAATATGILFVVRRNSQSFIIPAYIMGKLYSNSLLRVLNAQAKIGSRYSGSSSAENPGVTTHPYSYDRELMSQRACTVSGGQEVAVDRPETAWAGTVV